MNAIRWYQMTHDRIGSRYGWIIARKDSNGVSIWKKGFSRETFLSAAEMIVSRSADPTAYVVINPANKQTYRFVDIYYYAKHSGYMAIENVFSVA